MENNQSTQQLSQSSARSRRRPGQPANLYSLLALLQSQPWLMWVGVWVLLLAIAGIAMLSLTHGGYVEQEEPKPTPVVEAPQNIPDNSSQTGSTMPLWLLGAALTVVAGSLVIFRLKNSSRSSARFLTRRQQRRRLLEARMSVPTEAGKQESKGAEEQRGRGAEEQRGRGAEEQGSRGAGGAEGAEGALGSSQQNANYCEEDQGDLQEESINTETKPVVTVLPPEETQLDSSSESLAETMDIRKQRSLSSILQDNSNSQE